MSRARTNAEKDQRRQDLLSAALDEFFEKGFSAARMDDIAAHAELSKGALYLYFQSKEALFTELIETLTEPNIDILETVAANAPSLRAALDQIATIAPQIITSSDMPRLMKVIIGDAHNFPDIIRNFRRTVLERILGLVAGMLEQAQNNGEIVIADPQLGARLIMAPFALSGIWQAVFGADPDARVDLEGLFRMHADAFYNGVRRKGYAS